MSSAYQNETALSHTTDYRRSTIRSLQNHNRYPHTKRSDQHFIRRCDARPKRPTIRSTLPVHFRRWLATSDNEGEDSPPEVDQEPVDGGSNDGYKTFEHSRYFPAESHQEFCIPGRRSNQDELLEEEVASFASKYLNFDYEPSISVDCTVSAETSSSSPDAETEATWGTRSQPTEMSQDTAFGNGVDTNGVATRDAYPWGDYVYRPSIPPQHTYEQDDAQESQLARVKPRVRLEKRFAGKVVYGVKPIIAFSRVIHGRTIYNP